MSKSREVPGYVVQILHGGGYVKPAWATIYTTTSYEDAGSWIERYKGSSGSIYEFRIKDTVLKASRDPRAAWIDVNKSINWQP